MAVYAIPKATLGRVPIYIQYLRELPDESEKTISATKIAKALGLGEVQVRKDLALISGRGRPRVGYELKKLMRDLESHMGYDSFTNAVLVGAGKLGKAGTVSIDRRILQLTDDCLIAVSHGFQLIKHQPVPPSPLH